VAVRRLNYTNRRRIVREHVRIRLSQQDGHPPAFDADLILDGYDLAPDALVFLEARRQTRYMRFDFGTVGRTIAPTDRSLNAFDSGDGILFRVVVSSAGPQRGMILAEADQVPPITAETDGTRIPLLPVQGADSLGEQVWKLDFTNGPLLLINRNGVEWKTLAADPACQSLVFPAIVRQVLSRVVAEGGGETDPPTDWKGYWLAFGQALAPAAPLPEALEDWESVDDWIDSVVAEFCGRHGTFSRFLASFGEET
jgi:hypothetical protein